MNLCIFCRGPLNAAFILEEARREALDIGKLLTVVLLDAKSAFDVVVHKNLLKKLYHLGIQDKHWTLNKELTYQRFISYQI
jgi:hypothetical protein